MRAKSWSAQVHDREQANFKGEMVSDAEEMKIMAKPMAFAAWTASSLTPSNSRSIANPMVSNSVKPENGGREVKAPGARQIGNGIASHVTIRLVFVTAQSVRPD